MTGADQPVALPTGLRDRVLAASLQARPSGHSLPEAPAITAHEAFRRAAGAFSRALDGLTGIDWSRPALRGLDVQRLVGHLIGVEYDMHRCLAHDTGVVAADHVRSTQPAADRQAGRSPSLTHAEWQQAVDRTLELVPAAGDLEAEVAIHGLRLPLGALLTARAFELWTHENDVRAATGRPSSVPDQPTLHLMTALAVRLLPVAMAGTGFQRPTTLRLVLTGLGGGTWDLRLGDQGTGQVPVRIVTDVVGFCRLAANRVSAAELDLHISGDKSRAPGILAAVPALALD